MQVHVLVWAPIFRQGDLFKMLNEWGVMNAIAILLSKEILFLC